MCQFFRYCWINFFSKLYHLNYSNNYYWPPSLHEFLQNQLRAIYNSIHFSCFLRKLLHNPLSFFLKIIRIDDLNYKQLNSRLNFPNTLGLHPIILYIIRYDLFVFRTYRARILWGLTIVINYLTKCTLFCGPLLSITQHYSHYRNLEDTFLRMGKTFCSTYILAFHDIDPPTFRPFIKTSFHLTHRIDSLRHLTMFIFVVYIISLVILAYPCGRSTFIWRYFIRNPI